MCGIFGIINRKRSKFDSTTFNVLGINNDTRGGDSCGVFIDGRYEYGVGKLKYFEDFYRTSKVISSTKECEIALGHDRKASIGTIDEKTAQPVVLRDKKGTVKFVVIHNGTIYNYKELAKKYIPEIRIEGLTDSQVMAKIFYYKGYEVLDEYNGGAVFVIVDYRQPDPMILFFKGESKKYDYENSKVEEERPFYFIDDRKNGSLVFSSISKYLTALRPGTEVLTVTGNQLVQYNRKDGKLYLKRKVNRSKQCQAKPTVTVYGNNHNYGRYVGYTSYYKKSIKQNKEDTEPNINSTSTSNISLWNKSYIISDPKSNKYFDPIDKKPLHGLRTISRYGRLIEDDKTISSDSFRVWFFQGVALASKDRFKFLEHFKKKTKLTDESFYEKYEKLIRYVSFDQLYKQNGLLMKAIGVNNSTIYTGEFQMLGSSNRNRYINGEQEGFNFYTDFMKPLSQLEDSEDFKINQMNRICKSLMN